MNGRASACNNTGAGKISGKLRCKRASALVFRCARQADSAMYVRSWLGGVATMIPAKRCQSVAEGGLSRGRAIGRGDPHTREDGDQSDDEVEGQRLAEQTRGQEPGHD